MDDSFFRVLSEEEQIEFRQWARENFTPGSEINPVWHPVVRDECTKMMNEAIERFVGPGLTLRKNEE